ncbi:MAG: phosphoribosylformylglycinamidine synthase subunit PurL [Bacteroidetes bacterium]|nr:phosphoribosylformylglycinamidine synthase subunit PurL [Bacteroidota bacterium]
MSLTASETQLATVDQAKQLGLLPEEFQKIIEILGRTPNFTELSIYSVMWSEHCSYKNSIVWLKTLPKDGPHMLAKAGEENAGLVDIGDGWACAFKIESHNHPSALEPYQGAATGVGGINRDIFTMGARPIAGLNSLRFGDPNLDKTKWLVRGVVKGIGDYGNAFGIPTVGGEVFFDECYNVNPLVNAMSVGIVRVGETVSATSYGVGNPVFIVGSATGKDGIHGAAFASKDITEDSAKDLPAVQVGDPFQEKLLLEATLEVIKTGAVVGMQDMGAAGITCSTSEMSAKGEHGMVIWLDKVPTRQDHMKSWEILLSESQERMLIVAHKGREKEVLDVFEKWDLKCVQIGEVTAGDRLMYYMHDELVADVPAESLVLGGGAPVYNREYKEPAYFAESKKFSIDQVNEPTDIVAVAKHLTSHPNIASKRWVYNQYDSMVGTVNMSTNNPSDAAIVNLKGSNKALALKVDCNSRYVNADPETGCAIAVAEAARNITCSGGVPSGVTNCLNFGNPYNPEVYWQFVGSIKGMGKACLKFQTPVTGGNVSFYNQSSYEGPNSSEYVYSYHGIKNTPAPDFDLDEEYNVQAAIREMIQAGLVESAHDCADGGLFITLLESGMQRQLGFDITSAVNVRKDAFLFGEAQSRVIVSCAANNTDAIRAIAEKHGVEFNVLGTVKGNACAVDGKNFGTVADYTNSYHTKLETIMNN